ncbi:HIT family protein [Actinopolymorpha sp. B9G3]|uniref:HIT family protein n=1 Tax=Actinopolymorpha sp. B9G3 TaxID=3158970 RepID=UPI0032D966DA
MPIMSITNGFRLPRRDPCPYCRNLAGEPSPKSGPCAVVTEDELTRTFVNPFSFGGCPGHLLVIPKRHVESLFDLEPAEEAALMTAMMQAARAVRAVLDPDGVLLIQRNGIAAGQEVPHVHFHVIPRAAGTPVPPPEWVPLIEYAERQALAHRLSDYVKGLSVV